MRKSFFVTMLRPSPHIPATLIVAQTGSPEKSWLYSGMRANFTMRNLRTRWSISSCASVSVRSPRFRSRAMKMSRNVEMRPMDMAAPFCVLIAAR